VTGTHRHPDGQLRWPISLFPAPVKQICHGNIHLSAESVGEEGGERRVVNNRCETTCTSRRRPLLDNAATRRRWGRGGRTRRPLQQTICYHTDLPVDLLGRPVGGQATAHDTANCEVWTEVRGSSLIISNASNHSSLTAASAHVPISRIDNRDMRTRTRIRFDNRFFDYCLTCLVYYITRRQARDSLRRCCRLYLVWHDGDNIPD